MTLQVLPPAFKRSYLTYSDYRTMTEAAANTGSIWAYRLNSIFDPDSAGAGTTAMGYTALTGLYQTFRVVKTRVILRAGLTTTGNATIGLIPGLTAIGPANLNYACAEPNVRSKVVQGNVGGARSIAEIDVTYDLAKISGLTKQQYQTDMDFSHAAGSNPARNLYVQVFFVGMSAAVQTIFWNIRLVYEVEVSNPYPAVSS